MESCHFRDMKGEFEAVGAQRVGISADVVAKQKRVSDEQCSTTRCSPTPTAPWPRSSAFGRLHEVVADPGHLRDRADLTVLEVIPSEVRMNVHADRALEALKSSAAG